MEKIIIFFNIKELTEMNQTTVLSCLFFFKYYFGVIPFFSNYSYFFKLNISYFNFLIEYNFIKSLMFYSFFYFLNDVIYMINKIHVSYKITKNYWEFIINDMNFFLEKKNSLGFFNLKHKLVVQLYLQNHMNCDFNLLDTYKLKYEFK